jgi:ATP-dependent helicase Lhr and Lhr-like helicase
VVEFLGAQGHLHREKGLLTLGPKGERRFTGKRLADLCVSFGSPRAFSVLLGNKRLGDIDPATLKVTRDAPRVLALDGRSWRVNTVDWNRELVYVEPAEETGRSQ